MGSYLDYINEEGEIEDWPPKPASIARGDDYCWECRSYVQGGMSYEDCIKKCIGPGHHVIGHNGQLWLPKLWSWCARYRNWKIEQRAEREDAAVRLGVSVNEAMRVP